MTAFSDGLRPGDLVGDLYTIEKRIENGGWADVYRAHRRRDASDVVALKTIRPDLAADAEYRRLFRQEQERLKDFFVPNVCPVLDWSRSDEADPLWLVMKFLPGRTLGGKVQDDGFLDPAEASDLLLQAANGLHQVHAKRRIVHRDFHPKNLMVTPDGEAFVIDFGLAKRYDSSPSATPWIAFDSPYGAPELWRGEVLTPAADVFALGL